MAFQFLEQTGLTISIPDSGCLKSPEKFWLIYKECSRKLPCCSECLHVLHNVI
ncbi:Uncharacterized protein APZ42_001535 [Daphnia magna]|uniref:Uncharacterized protein n=1 Tax=Daphnia magna TaxID=35525 RepID=A0A164IX25_9CRUS|nr:Uncharacterized protein APZ42_001535 [Daphnia magna]